jgi:DNA-binding MarR family transcriptional regulator
MNTNKRQVSDTELAEVMPLVGAVAKVVQKSGHQMPNEMHALWVKHGLAPRHMNTLLSLAFRGPASVSDLSTRLGVGLATASLVVGELSRVGLVLRREDEADRRRTLVDLAPGYRQMIRGALAQKMDAVRGALEQLDPRERVALKKGLKALISAFEESVPAAASSR